MKCNVLAAQVTAGTCKEEAVPQGSAWRCQGGAWEKQPASQGRVCVGVAAAMPTAGRSGEGGLACW